MRAKTTTHMKFNTEIIITSPLTGEKSKWQGPQIEADDFQQAEKAAFASVIYVTGENVPRDHLSVDMQPPRTLAFSFGYETSYPYIALEQVCAHLVQVLDDLEKIKINSILKTIGYQVFNPSDHEVIRMKNENLLHPDFVSKLDEAEAIGGVVISYLPEV